MEIEGSQEDITRTDGPFPAEGGLSGWGAIGLFLLYMGVQVATGFLVVALIDGSARSQHFVLSEQEIRSWIVPAATVLAFLLGGVVVLHQWTRLSGADGLRALIPRAPWTLHGAAATLGLGLAAANLVAVGILLAGREPPPQGPLQAMAASPGLGRICFVALALALAPFFEEIVFRGVLLEGLSRPLGLAGAVVGSTLLFTAMHGPEIAAFWPAGVSIFALGLLSCAVKRRSGSLAPCMTLHFSYNALLVGMVMAARLLPGA